MPKNSQSSYRVWPFQTRIDSFLLALATPTIETPRVWLLSPKKADRPRFSVEEVEERSDCFRSPPPGPPDLKVLESRMAPLAPA